MFFRRAFGKNHDNDYSKETFEEMSPDQFESPPSPPPAYHNSNSNCNGNNNPKQSRQTKTQYSRRGSFGEKEKLLKTSAINCGGGLR